ncbi:MAG: type II toxin-antitoxin system RelB/DinJ family antitoxin [Candidatus Gracilibacteria bacterium]|nr:type II toxin-antitoxin system RelB/DinJ family antitoxin [Candidatus Gracilibacteria bacterium]
MTTLTLRIDADLKLELQEMAKNLGLSLNQLMNLNIRDFVKKKELNVSLKSKIEFLGVEAIEGSEDFIGTNLHKRGLDLLSKI